jgi:purine catabolism regulator
MVVAIEERQHSSCSCRQGVFTLGITVNEALEIGGLRKGEVIAGRDGLDNVIQHVSVIEVPDAFRWFRGYELWLTAFFNLKDNIQAQVQMIEEIWKRKSAGLVICYPDTYMRGISTDLVDKADSLKIPVILVPEDVAYIDVISPLLEEILARETKKIRYAFSVHERLTNIVFDRGKAGNMKKVARELSLILDKPVVLTDHRNNVVTSHSRNPKGAALGDPSSILDLLAMHEQDLQNGRTLYIENSLRLMLRPIVFGHRFYGTVVVLDVDGVGKLEEIAIDQARIAFAAGLMNRIAMEESENQRRTDFLNDLLRGRFKTDESLLVTAQQFSWDMQGKRIALYANLDTSAKARPQIGDLARARVSETVWQDNPSNICVFGNTSISVFLEGHEPYRQIKDRAKVLGKALVSVIRVHEGVDAVVGIGSYAGRPLDLKTSYEKARRTALISKELMGFGKAVSIDDVAFYYYLDEMAAGEEIRNYIVSQVQQLKEHDKCKGTDLYRTFEMLLNDEPVAEIASRLCIHRNTINYRKDRIKNILGIDPFQEPFKTNYRMVLSLYSLLNRY